MCLQDARVPKELSLIYLYVLAIINENDGKSCNLSIGFNLTSNMSPAAFALENDQHFSDFNKKNMENVPLPFILLTLLLNIIPLDSFFMNS